MADPQTPQQQTAPQQQQGVDNGPAELSTANQPAGTTKIENGIAYDISGKPLGPANMTPKVDYKAVAAEMGGTPKVDYKAVAAQMGGTPSAPGTKTAPQQTIDLLTYALAKGKNLLKGGGEYGVPDNAELAQAKNASDYIYNNVLGKDTYAHSGLTYDQTPTSAAGKLWQRLWGWATQDEINKIPGIEPDRVEALRASGNDLLSRMLGPQNAKDFRQYVENGFSIPVAGYGTVSSKALDPIANPEVYARAAAKTLTDFFSPGYYTLGAFGKVAQGYQKAAQIAADAGDMAKAVSSFSKARLLAILSTGVNVPFAASQAYDLVEHWDQMNVPERVAAVSGILGAALNAHIGVEHLGGYSQVAQDAIADTKATAQEIAQSKAAQATKKAVGSMVTLGKAQTFEEAIQRGSSLTGKKFRQQQANIRSASPELQAVALENPQAETPGQFADAIHNWLQQREQVLLQSSGGTKGSDVPVSSTLEADVRQRLDRFFDDNRGKYGNDEQVEAAKQQIMSRLMLQSKATGAPPSLRMPNAFETENIRQGLNQEIKPQLNGTPTTAAYKAAVQQTVPLLREALDKFYNDKGVKNVKEFRAKEATMINVADRLEAAEKRAQEMGNGSIWASLAKKFSVPTIITSIALGHNPLAFGALAPYLMGERAYQNYKNPGVNIRRAIELAEPRPITDLDVQPPTGAPGAPSAPPAGPAPMVGPSGVAHTSAPIHPTRAGQAAAAVAAATMPEPPTNHTLNSQLATHFGEPLDHASLDDRIERVKNDAEAMRRSGVDISKTQTGKMLGAINEHESEHTAKIEAEQQKAHEDAAKVVQELHDEFQKLQEENRKKLSEGKNQPNQAATAFTLPYETTDEELPTSKVAGKTYSGFNTRLHELGHLIWSHEMGMQPFDVLAASHPEAEGAHAVARSDISRLLNPDGTNNKEAFKANLGDLVSRFLAGAVAEDIHGGVPMEGNKSATTDVATVEKIFDALEVPQADRKRITQQAVAQLRETFSKPEVAEIMNAFASKRKAGLSPEYHFDETQVHQLRQALDAAKGEPDGTKETIPSLDKGTRRQSGGVGEKPVAGRERGGAPEVGRLNQAPAGLVERTTGSEDADAAIRNGGGIPAGFMNVPGHGDYRMFHDPESGSTLAFKPHEAITPQTVGKKLATSRAEFEEGNRREAARQAQPQQAASVNVPSEITAGEHDKAIKEGGAVPGGIAKGDTEFNEPDLVQFHDPKTGSTLALPAGEVTAEKVRQELEKSRKQFAAGKKEKSVLEAAVKHYGVTDEPKKMGYILPDGRGLDFSDGQASRTLDHGDVSEVMPTPRGENPRDRFVRETGAARFVQSSYDTGVVLPSSGATPKMAETIARAIEQHPRGKKELTVDLLHTPEEFEKVADQAGARSTIGSATGEAKDVEGVQRVIRDAKKDATRRAKAAELQPRQNAPASAVAKGADEYNEKAGRPAIDATVKPHDPEFAKRVADAYDAMKHEPNVPAVKKSYEAMANEVKKQWGYATKEMGMKFEPWTKEGQPYANSKEMMKDVRDNKHLYFFQGGEPKSESPMAKVDPKTGFSYNDMFRAVHDLFGHAAHGFEFGPKGEENAYLVHRQMFPSEAIPALTSETRGQNSWVNFGKHLRGASGEVAKKGEEGYVPPAQRPYAEQKVGLLPEEFHGATKGDWAAGVEKAPFGGVNPNNPEAPSKTYGFEIAPEHRHNPEKLTADEARAYAERPDVKAALAAHPDVKLGWDTTTQGPELNIGASTDDLDTAKKIAGKLDQRAIVNTQTGEEIPAGGQGKKTAFPDYPLADRLKDLDAGKLQKAAPKDEEKEYEIRGTFEDGKVRTSIIKATNLEEAQKRANREWQAPTTKVEVLRAIPKDETNQRLLKKFYEGNPVISKPPEGEVFGVYQKGVLGPDDFNHSSAWMLPDGNTWAQESEMHSMEDADQFLPSNVVAITHGSGTDAGINIRFHDMPTASQLSEIARLVKESGDSQLAYDLHRGFTYTPEEGTAGTLGQMRRDLNRFYESKDLDAGRLEKAKEKEEPKEFAENPEGLKHIAPQVLQHLEPDEQAFIKDNKRAQVQIQKHYDEIKPTIDETKAAMQAGQALGGWWRRYIDTFNALGEHTNEEVASKLGPKHADALKVWHAAVSGNKPVEAANRIAWGSYADWLDQGMPRDRASLNKILSDNAAVTDTHYGKNTKKAGQVKKEGLDTTKLFRLVNSPEMRQIDPTPFHGDVFDPNRPSPIYGTTSGARKIPSMGATVAGEGNLNRLVLDTHMKDYFGENKWTDNKYLAFSAHIRQAARELGLQPGEGQEQLWGTVLGIKKLLYEGLPDSEIPDELTNDLIEGIGKDYAQIIKDDPELSDIFERLKAHGIDPGGNRAQERLAAILEGKRPAEKAPANQTRLAESAARIRANLKDVPPPDNTLRFNFGANALKMEQAAPKEWPKTIANERELADFIEEHSPEEVDREHIQEYFHNTKAELKNVPVQGLKQGGRAINVRNPKLDEKYSNMSSETRPPIVVENGVVVDGNHRLRAAKKNNEKSILAYVVSER